MNDGTLHPKVIPSRLRLVLCIAGVFSLILAWFSPPLAGPDETAHVAYVAALANGHMPQLGGMHQADITTGVTFQAQHPPLFYALAAPIFKVFAANLPLANRITRLLGVASFLLTIFLVYHVATLLSDDKNSSWPLLSAIFVAANPHLLLISSFVNNDALAILLGTLCLWCAAHVAASKPDTRRKKPWLLLAALAGGLALLTKFTALSLVVAAALLAGQKNTTAENAAKATKNLGRGAILLFLAALFVVPWLFYMKNAYGSIAPQQFTPVFEHGIGEALTQPEVAIYAAYMVWGELCLGLALPLWQTHTLFGDFPLYFYFEWFLGFVFGLFCCWLAWRERQRWALFTFPLLWMLIWSQALFRDREAMLFASRYGPTAAGILALLFASCLARQSPKLQSLVTGVWLFCATGIYLFLFLFLTKSH